jgi:putative transposase
MPEPIKRIPYPGDLSYKEWEIIKPLIPAPQTNRGRKRTHPYREILNAIFYPLTY